jgi:NAD(P)-dependent dehydrogenase (short-subunit alcohol dehydrogenase family)
LGGLVGLPFQSLYSASKFALEGAMEALRLEVAPFGIHVSLIQPGNFRTNFTDRRQLVSTIGSGSPYADQFRQALEVIESDERNGPEPARVAQTLEKILRSPKPKLRYPAAHFPESLLPIARRLLPDSLIGYALRAMHRMD